MLSHLFSPIRIGNLTVKNRLMMSAMSINFGVDDNCHVTEQLMAYFVERARGGAGMMLVGGGSVHPGGQELPDLPQMYEDGCIPALKRMVDQVRPFGTRFGVQLMHGGRQSYLPEKVAPSPIPAPAVVKGEVRALTVAEIRHLVACFGDAARRCRDAGFDFVEIHGAHGYLINQFMSPNANIRTDEYGGSFENRTRFLFEILADIRARAGEDFPVGIRINGNDYMENGWELTDALTLAPLLEAAGVAYVHVSAGVYGSTELTIPSMYTPQGCFVHLAEAVKQVVGIPVITVGRIKDPVHAEQIIARGQADMVALGRSFLADPHYPEKARTGRIQEIRPCVGCCLGCIHAVLAKEPGGCVVNPDVGREYLMASGETAGESAGSIDKPRVRILVAGAGPAGLAAARECALAGHDVVICEQGEGPGGLLGLAAKAPGRGELKDILQFFDRELARLDISVRYQTPLTQDLLKEISPDHVVLATGSMPQMPVIKGLFTTSMHLVTGVDVMAGTETAGEKVMVLGGGMAGLIVADFLADQGKTVVVLNRKKSFAEEMSSNDRYYLRERLKKGDVTLYKQVSIQGFTPDGVIFSSKGEKITLAGFDTVVISEKFEAVRAARSFEKTSAARFHVIGDAKSPRHLMYCIAEARELAATF
ncbi:MAG: FAD-dependent oxidoreductase [Desulfotignum balticum]|jgi:2,4-dienoyl-CoA reductase-like NADH-dependent reductase (Old Yellow Enzyme family)/thioredoxin reductase|uniref:FAD-dependent oxidoreductase n=1 Tax=Desulfotignum balticum TaxID=115781 RepID=A0A931G719_9BACT|nr:FAD-dependent oxidoreductase [Desulfotignum balticum]